MDVMTTLLAAPIELFYKYVKNRVLRFVLFFPFTVVALVYWLPISIVTLFVLLWEVMGEEL